MWARDLSGIRFTVSVSGTLAERLLWPWTTERSAHTERNIERLRFTSLTCSGCILFCWIWLLAYTYTYNIYIYIYIYICILPFVCSRDMLQLFGKGLIGFLWKYVSNSHRIRHVQRGGGKVWYFNVIWLKSIHTFTFIVTVFTASASIGVSARNASLYIAVMIFCAPFIFWAPAPPKVSARPCTECIYNCTGQGFFICHMINYTGYNQKWNVDQIRSAQWTVQWIKII